MAYIFKELSIGGNTVVSGKELYAPLAFYIDLEGDISQLQPLCNVERGTDTLPQLYSCDIAINPSNGVIEQTSELVETDTIPTQAYQVGTEQKDSYEYTLSHLIISDLDFTNFTAKMYYFKLSDIPFETASLGKYLKNDYFKLTLTYLEVENENLAYLEYPYNFILSSGGIGMGTFSNDMFTYGRVASSSYRSCTYGLSYSNVSFSLLEVETGESSGSGIIEVDTLPTTNIDTNAIYKTPRKFTDIYVFVNGGEGYGCYDFKLGDSTKFSGTEVVETKPTSNIKSSTMEEFYLYYVTSENDIFAYIDIGYGLMWLNASQLLEAANLTGLTFQGEFEYGAIINGGNGYYAYFENEKHYKVINNQFVELNTSNSSICRFMGRGKIERIETTFIDSAISANYLTSANIDYLKLIATNTTTGYGFDICDAAFYLSKIKTIYLKHINRETILKISSGAFQHCEVTKIVLDFGIFESIPTNVFLNSSIANGTGYIYVPDDQVETVKALSGYSTYASQIRPLSEYVEE